MSENKENNKKNKNRGKELFVRVVSGILAILMIAGVASTFIFYLLG